MSGTETPEPTSAGKALPLNDGMDVVEKEYIDFTEGEATFYHPFTAPTRMENNIIEFDLQNLRKLLLLTTEQLLESFVRFAVALHIQDEPFYFHYLV